MNSSNDINVLTSSKIAIKESNFYPNSLKSLFSKKFKKEEQRQVNFEQNLYNRL